MMKTVLNIALNAYFKETLRILESLDVVRGSGEDRKVLINKFFKLKDKKDGLVYTVSDLDLEDIQNPIINCYGFDKNGNKTAMQINKNMFKNFERA